MWYFHALLIFIYEACSVFSEALGGPFLALGQLSEPFYTRCRRTSLQNKQNHAKVAVLPFGCAV